MARARNIKPALFKNEVLGVADPLYTLCFEGLWLLADRDGRLEDRPIRIRAEIFPYREGLNIESILEWLACNDFIIRYRHGENRYIQIVNFAKHQNPHKNEAPSEIPEFTTACNGSDFIGTGSDFIGCAPADSLSLDSLSSDSLSTETGKDQKHLVTDVTDFESFWKLYPRKTAKSEALKSWGKLNPDQPMIELITAGLANHITCESWLADDGKYIPHASTWLNQKRWQDSPKQASNVTPINRHSGFNHDYTDGLQLREDGTHAF